MKKPKPKTIALAGCVAAVLVVGIWVGGWLFGREDSPPEPLREYLHARGFVATEDNIDELFAQAAALQQFSHYEARMSIEWDFETATTPSANAYVKNLPTNPSTVFFDLVLPETGQLLFSSPYLPLGSRLDNIVLDVELPPGVYHPNVIYHLVDEDYEVRATVTVGITMRILN